MAKRSLMRRATMIAALGALLSAYGGREIWKTSEPSRTVVDASKRDARRPLRSPSCAGTFIALDPGSERSPVNHPDP